MNVEIIAAQLFHLPSIEICSVHEHPFDLFVTFQSKWGGMERK